MSCFARAALPCSIIRARYAGSAHCVRMRSARLSLFTRLAFLRAIYRLEAGMSCATTACVVSAD